MMSKPIASKGTVRRTRPGNGGVAYMFPEKHVPNDNSELQRLVRAAQAAGISYGKYVAQQRGVDK